MATMTSVNCDPSWMTTMSSVGSMITMFEPEPHCLKDLYLDDDDGDLYLNPQMDSKCFPPNFPDDASNHAVTYYYYSPAVCPSGYTSACGETCLAKPLPMSETAMRCCPVGYTCQDKASYCASLVTEATEVTLTNQQKVTTVPASSSRKAYALGIYARHQSTDLEALASATEGAATGIHTAQETESGNSSADTESSESSGLSTGAKIAIGVIVPLVVIAAALIVFCLCWRKRSKAKDDTHQPSGPWVKPELDSTEVELTEQRIYDAKGPVKIPPHMYELPDTRVYHEMDSQQPAWPHKGY